MNTRNQIIASLKTRRKTLAELSRELGLAPSTVYEHMQKLESEGIVRKVDEGRKWKYYELVGEKRVKERAVSVERVRFLAVLMEVTLVILFAYYWHLQTAVPGASKPVQHIAMATPQKMMEVAGAETTGKTKATYELELWVTGGLALVLGAGILVSYLWQNKKQRRET